MSLNREALAKKLKASGTEEEETTQFETSDSYSNLKDGPFLSVEEAAKVHAKAPAKKPEEPKPAPKKSRAIGDKTGDKD